jgi:hypothetical protein
VVRRGIVAARVLGIGNLPMIFLDQWWHIAAVGEDEFHVVMVVGIEVVEFGNVAEVGVAVGLVVWLLEWRLLPLLLQAKDLNVVLELRESCSFFVDVLPSSFSTIRCCWSPCDGFLFLSEPLDLRWCHTPVRESGTEASIRVSRMFNLHV